MTVSQLLKSSASVPAIGDATRRRPVLYRGPDVPVAYEANWGKYENLTRAQTEWFQSQPQDLIDYAAQQARKADVVEIAHSGGIIVRPVINGAGVNFVMPGKDIRTVSTVDISAAHAEYLTRWQGLQSTLATVSAAITASPPTVTKREHVDAAFKYSHLPTKE